MLNQPLKQHFENPVHKTENKCKNW